MEYTVTDEGNHRFIALKGELDLYKTGKLKRELVEAIGDESTSLVIDMTDLKYMDSSGIALMAFLQKHMKSRSGSFAFLKVNDEIMNVLKLAALDNFFKIYTSRDQVE